MTDGCLICGRPAPAERFAARDAWKIDCPHCGKFQISGSMFAAWAPHRLPPEEQALLPYLSAVIRRRTRPYLRAENREAIDVFVFDDDWKQIAAGEAAQTVSRKISQALEIVARSASALGSFVEIDTDLDVPLFSLASRGELYAVLGHLTAERLLDRAPSGTSWGLTIQGWQKLEPIAPRGIPGRCFVAMSFDPLLDDAYLNGIVPAIRECGLDPRRMREIEHNEKICDRILAEIRLAQVVVADFTGQRTGVFFEAGFALGLGRDVIWMCRETEFEGLKDHFDTRQYAHISWADTADVRRKLSDRIRATVLSPEGGV